MGLTPKGLTLPEIPITELMKFLTNSYSEDNMINYFQKSKIYGINKIFTQNNLSSAFDFNCCSQE